MVEVECKTMDMAARKARVAALVDIFGRDLDYYKSRAFVESECRSKFIDPFLECLGWDVRNQKGARHSTWGWQKRMRSASWRTSPTTLYHALGFIVANA